MEAASCDLFSREREREIKGIERGRGPGKEKEGEDEKDKRIFNCGLGACLAVLVGMGRGA